MGITMVLIETLNGNYVLKSPEKVRDTDYVEMEFYGETMTQVKEHKKDTK